MSRPKYAIAYGKGIYWIVKKTIFGYRSLETESFAGVRLEKSFTTFEEAKDYLQWYVLDKYLN